MLAKRTVEEASPISRKTSYSILHSFAAVRYLGEIYRRSGFGGRIRRRSGYVERTQDAGASPWPKRRPLCAPSAWQGGYGC